MKLEIKLTSLLCLHSKVVHSIWKDGMESESNSQNSNNNKGTFKYSVLYYTTSVYICTWNRLYWISSSYNLYTLPLAYMCVYLHSSCKFSVTPFLSSTLNHLFILQHLSWHLSLSFVYVNIYYIPTTHSIIYLCNKQFVVLVSCKRFRQSKMMVKILEFCSVEISQLIDIEVVWCGWLPYSKVEKRKLWVYSI